jgi:tRNA-splicing ligase RtcB
MAKELAQREGRVLPDKDLAWLDEGSAEFKMYTEALSWAQDYAAHNRDLMLHLCVKVMHKHFGERFAIIGKATNCHHNYANLETHFGEQVWVTRKGAVSAREGEMGIIPGSMGAKSFIVRGKGNAMSYCSCSHGAGRKHSRTAAKKLFTVDDLKQQTAGVECRKDAQVVDEIPAAYKDIDDVMAAQQDLVEVVATLKQVLCIKG